MQIKVTELPTFYINLDDRPDRKKKMESMLTELGFTNYQRFKAHKADKRVGCSVSHSNVLEEIIKSNIYPALVLEDDVDVYQPFRDTVESPDSLDAMYLGISRYGFNSDPNDPHPRSLKISKLGEHYHRLHNMLARHAIIHFNTEYDMASIDLMKTFINDPEQYYAGDATLSRLHPLFNVYAQNIPLFYQNDRGTAGLTKHTIYDCNYLEVDKL